MNSNESLKISLIIPVWNVEKYIIRHIKSIVNQTYDNIEIIIVNDCSTDNSIKLIEPILKTSGRIYKIIHHTINKGLGAARLTGLNNSTGEYVLNLDSDDWIDIDFVKDLVKDVKSYDSDIVITDYYISYSNQDIYRAQLLKSQNGKILAKQIMSGELQGFLCNKLIRRSLFFENNIFPIEGINMWEDMHVICRLSYFAERVSHINKAYYHYNQENINSYSVKKISENGCRNIKQVIDIVSEFYTKVGDLEMMDSLYKFQSIGKSMCLLKGEPFFRKECASWPVPACKTQIHPGYMNLILDLSNHGYLQLIGLLSTLIDYVKYIRLKLIYSRNIIKLK